MKPISSKGWFPCLDQAIAGKDIPAFPTKSAAQIAAKEYGWGSHVIRITRRFETVWIAGLLDFQSDNEQGITFDVLRLPVLRWCMNEGAQFCPILKLRKNQKEKQS